MATTVKFLRDYGVEIRANGQKRCERSRHRRQLRRSWLRWQLRGRECHRHEPQWCSTTRQFAAAILTPPAHQQRATNIMASRCLGHAPARAETL